MIRPLAMFCLALPCALAAEREDMLRFTNGDQLRGRFEGFQDGPLVNWSHDDLAEPAGFKTERIRQIVLNAGRPQQALDTLSHIGLTNRDLLPGRISAFDDESLTLETSFAGTLVIPRKHVSRLAPNPMGGRMHYHGPFSEDEWRMTNPAHPDGLPEPAADADESPDDAPGRWTFSGSAWYWQHNRGGTALTLPSAMPESAVLRFDIAWKSRLSLTIAFHADFVSPKQEEDPEKRRIPHPMEIKSLPLLFGNSQVLQLHSNYLALVRTSVDESGKSATHSDNRNNHQMRLGESGQATIEIRNNRRNGDTMLFINDEFVAQWNGAESDDTEPGADESAESLQSRSGIGFVVQTDDCPIRISDIVICEWNGMPDSARSLQLQDHDVVLMTNGTDRYAGKVGNLDQDGRVLFDGRHGQFRLPLSEIAEIRFARDSLASVQETPADNLLVRFSPVGSLSGRPLGGDRNLIRLENPLIGNMAVSLDAATMLDFNPSHIIIDDWDNGF